MSGPVGRLHAEASVGSTVIVGHVVVANPLGVVLVLDDYVIEAVPAGACRSPSRKTHWPWARAAAWRGVGCRGLGHGGGNRRRRSSRGRG